MSVVATTPIPAEHVRPRDIIRFLGTDHRVVEVIPYEGPMRKLGCFATAVAVDGWDYALYRGQFVDVV